MFKGCNNWILTFPPKGFERGKEDISQNKDDTSLSMSKSKVGILLSPICDRKFSQMSSFKMKILNWNPVNVHKNFYVGMFKPCSIYGKYKGLYSDWLRCYWVLGKYWLAAVALFRLILVLVYGLQQKFSIWNLKVPFRGASGLMILAKHFYVF